MSGGGYQREVIPSENEPWRLFSGVVGGGGCQGLYPPNTSTLARIQEWWVVMVASERSYLRKQGHGLVFGGCGWWWWLEKGQTPENKPRRSFFGGCGCWCGKRKAITPKTSQSARSRGWWVVVVARERSTSRKRAEALVFGGCGGWWWPKKGHAPKNEPSRSFWGLWLPRRGHTPPKTSCRARFRGLWVLVVGEQGY